ncbi:MAG: S-layer homology domain-containing protein, partial [Moorella sp. (in: Bacteria)]|nr:S-layer homology domain-containing protein [Moorella sp. (in: firmicutes)]
MQQSKILSAAIFSAVLLILIFLLITLCRPQFAFSALFTQEKGGFCDLENHWAASAAYRLAALDLFAGYPDGTFRPERPLSRLEAVALVMRAGGFADAETGPGRTPPKAKTGAAKGAAGTPAGSGPQSEAGVPSVPWGREYVRLA